MLVAGQCSARGRNYGRQFILLLISHDGTPADPKQLCSALGLDERPHTGAWAIMLAMLHCSHDKLTITACLASYKPGDDEPAATTFAPVMGNTN